MAQADAPPLYWSDDVEDADWAGAVADPAVVAGAWLAWRQEVAAAEQFAAGDPTSPSAALCETARPSRCAR